VSIFVRKLREQQTQTRAVRKVLDIEEKSQIKQANGKGLGQKRVDCQWSVEKDGALRCQEVLSNAGRKL
jgi:hypothetical protein